MNSPPSNASKRFIKSYACELHQIAVIIPDQLLPFVAVDLRFSYCDSKAAE